MKKLIIGVSLGIVFLFSFVSCRNILPSKKEAKTSDIKTINGPLLAQVDSWRIGLDDFDKRLEALAPLAKQQKVDINDYDFKSKVLQELVRTVLLAELAEDRGLDKEKDVINALSQYKQTLLAQKVISDATKDIDITDVEIENFYDQNKDYFKKPAEIRAREIVVNDKNTANGLYIRILQGESVSSLAKQYSRAKSAYKGGDLGYISYSKDKPKKFWEIISALDKGELSSVFKGEDGKYYIVKVEDKKEGRVTPLSDIKEDIRNVLKVDKVNKKVEELVNSAKSKANVVINEDLLR